MDTPNHDNTNSENNQDQMDLEPTQSQPSTDIMTQIMSELKAQKERLDQHDTMYTEILKLRQELEAANAQIARLEETNRQLHRQLSSQQQTRPEYDPVDFPPLPALPTTPDPDTLTNRDSQWKSPPRIRLQETTVSMTTKQRRLEAAARAFQRLSDTHGFQYLYFPSRARIPVGTMRNHLRRFGVDNSRVLDIQYPARQTIGLLVHNDFVSTLLEKLKAVKIHPADFDPHDPKPVHDPKYQDESIDFRTQKAIELQCNRARKAIQFIRTPIKYAVARDFHEKHWLSIEELKAILATKWIQPDDPEAIASNFQPANHNDNEDVSMTSADNNNAQKRHFDDIESDTSY